MKFVALIALFYLFAAVFAQDESLSLEDKKKKTKSPTSNCPVPPKGCNSQKSMYSCMNPAYVGCEWSCGKGNKWCTATFNDPRFPEHGTPNQNRDCKYKKGKGCCTTKKDCILTSTPTQEPTQEPTLQPTNQPIPPTPPTKQPTLAPTVRCAPQPAAGCLGIKPETKLQCLGASDIYSGCCLWTPNPDPTIPGGKCTLR